ncbi:MAG: helix-turn-helix domain-containing protein [Microscillaceae bacterium]
MPQDIFKSYRIGHFLNQPHHPTEFAMLRFETMAEPNVDDYHKHTFYEVLWVEKGTSRQVIDYQEYEVRPNSLFFISPNQVHYFEEWQPVSGGTLMFTEDFYLLNRANKDTLFELSFLDNLHDQPCITFKENEFARILKIIHQIEQEWHQESKNPAIVQSYLHILMAQVQRHVEATQRYAPAKKYLVLFKQFKNELEKHFAEGKTTAFYAEKMHITAHHLNRVCKEITQQTASEVIRNRRILEAKRYLTFTEKTVSEIAFDLNFTDSSYFAKVFKAVTHQNPLDFKKEMSEKYRKK